MLLCQGDPGTFSYFGSSDVVSAGRVEALLGCLTGGAEDCPDG